jgi:hypothetical protein
LITTFPKLSGVVVTMTETAGLERNTSMSTTGFADGRSSQITYAFTPSSCQWD